VEFQKKYDIMGFVEKKELFRSYNTNFASNVKNESLYEKGTTNKNFFQAFTQEKGKTGKEKTV